MQYRRFGRTDLSMPVFSCGGMRYQQTWDDAALDVVEKENQRNLRATIDRAMELGVTHIETARGYGTSERQLGLVLPELREKRPVAAQGGPEGLIVQTKIAPHKDPKEFRRQVLDSLERLRMDRVDLLGLHGINTHEILWHAVRPGGCLEVARQLQKEGRCGHVGFSTHGSTDLIVDAVTCELAGGFDYVNLHWYYINQWNWPAVEAATKHDVGVFIISPNDKGGMLYKPPAKLVELCEPLHPIVFNSLFCLQRPEVHTLSLGASQPSDFDLQMSALPLLERLDEVLPPILARLRQAMVEAVGEDAADRFREGLPAWDDGDNAGYINAPIVLWLRHLALAYDLTEYGKMRYNLLGNGGHWFSGLGAAHLDTMTAERLEKAYKKSPFADQIVDWLRDAHLMLGGAEVERLGRD
ncbi:Aldo/keto reductase family protein [Botrimarina colliarenosi]|uniref:Aldo/keto reductase family protein n=1 Tax=Botrimarina colliarenosi TaxID=2528001 RepID=A0A5C6A5P2_9BACT|nr:aldo/keto reductase [Botrimarina colliarenosi]TWT95302.1 Aldo/keto reductase family protein [Botrimarina colliarenosi]